MHRTRFKFNQHSDSSPLSKFPKHLIITGIGDSLRSSSPPRSLKNSQKSLAQAPSKSVSFQPSFHSIPLKKPNLSFILRRNPVKVRGVMMDLDYISNSNLAGNTSTPALPPANKSSSAIRKQRIPLPPQRMPRIHSRKVRYSHNQVPEVINIVTDSKTGRSLSRKKERVVKSKPGRKNKSVSTSFDNAYTNWVFEEDSKIDMFNHD
jgi:hypothetical protein